jgi:hypothetical protein
VLPFAVVLRRVLVLLCAVFLLQETNLGSLIVGAACPEKCADDVVPGHCSPICAACACGTHASPIASRVTRLPAPADQETHGFAGAALATGDLHLPEILHVPKRLVA